MNTNGRWAPFPTRRRVLVSAIATLGALASPFAPFAQSPTKIWRIGVLHPGRKPAPELRDPYTGFFEALRELGYAEGNNIVVQWQFAENRSPRLATIAAQFVNQKLDLIVTSGTPAVHAAQQATTTIPIIALTFVDPVSSGFAKSLARPGGNITGTTTLGEELDTKRLQILTEIAPHVTRIAYLVNPDYPVVMRWVSSLEAAARKINKAIVLASARTENELNAAFAQIVRDRGGAVLVAQDWVLNGNLQRIGELAMQHRLPSVFGSGIGGVEYGLANYVQDVLQTGRSAAVIAVKIFKGAKPADIPIEQPTHFRLEVNLKIAKALGITIPPMVMVQATRGIE